MNRATFLLLLLLLALLPVTALAERDPSPPPSNPDAAFVAYVEAQAAERNERGGLVAPTPAERASIEAALRGNCDGYGFSPQALAWLEQYHFCRPTGPTPPPTRP